jgi:hypothetical protein
MKNKKQKANLAMRSILGVSALIGLTNSSEASDGILKFLNNSSASSPNVVMINGYGSTDDFEGLLDHEYLYDFYDNQSIVDFYIESGFDYPDDMLSQEGHSEDSMTSFYGVLSGRNLPDPNALTNIEVTFFNPDRYLTDKVKAVWDVYERKMNKDLETMEDEPYVYEPYGSWNVVALSLDKSNYKVPFVVEETIGEARTDFHYPHYRWEVKFRDGNGWAGCDSNLDDIVNMNDFAKMSRFYGVDCRNLEKGTLECYDCYNADSTGDDMVDVYDLINIANHWLDGVIPEEMIAYKPE